MCFGGGGGDVSSISSGLRTETVKHLDDNDAECDIRVSLWMMRTLNMSYHHNKLMAFYHIQTALFVAFREEQNTSWSSINHSSDCNKYQTGRLPATTHYSDVK